MFWGRTSRVFVKYSNLMSAKQTDLKEKLRQALSSTIRVISDDFEIKKTSEKNNNLKQFNSFELENLNNKYDFIKARADCKNGKKLLSFLNRLK